MKKRKFVQGPRNPLYVKIKKTYGGERYVYWGNLRMKKDASEKKS